MDGILVEKSSVSIVAITIVSIIVVLFILYIVGASSLLKRSGLIKYTEKDVSDKLKILADDPRSVTCPKLNVQIHDLIKAMDFWAKDLSTYPSSPKCIEIGKSIQSIQDSMKTATDKSPRGYFAEYYKLFIDTIRPHYTISVCYSIEFQEIAQIVDSMNFCPCSK